MNPGPVDVASWLVRAYLRAGARVVRAVIGDSGQPAESLDELADPGDPPEADERPTRSALRARAAELLRRSAELDWSDDEAHPAYVRILSELAPDEVRILRLLAREGPQPAVDVRTGGPVGKLKDELIAPGLNMIGMEAGLRRSDAVPRHLDNLNRLGLIWFSREQLADQSRYHVLEAQPDVTDAMARAGRTRTVRRTIHLTPFGEDFCRTCLPVEDASL